MAMECFNCGEPLNPTLVYCSGCGAPSEAGAEDVIRDEEERVEWARRISAQQQAKGLLVLAVFLFACVVAVRTIMIKKTTNDAFTSFRAPYALVDEAKLDPPTAIDVEALEIPFPKVPGQDDDGK